MITLFRRHSQDDSLCSSRLLDERTFSPAFMKDINQCKRELVIESPFIAHKRMNALYPSFRRLTKRGVRIIINTRHPSEREPGMRIVASDAVELLLEMDVTVLFTGGHHRKLAILDRQVLYEGSLNILSQNDSCEIMRRIESDTLAQSMIDFIQLNRFI